MTVIPIYRPYVFLRCRKCGRKTDHVLINTTTIRKGEMEETYECQQCGETKKIYELASMVEPQHIFSAEKPTPEVEEKLAIHGLEEKIKTKREAVEQLESKKKDLEKRLKVPTTVAPAGNQQPKKSAAPAGDQQPKKPEEDKEKEKKKRKWF